MRKKILLVFGILIAALVQPVFFYALNIPSAYAEVVGHCPVCGRNVYPSEDFRTSGNAHYHKACAKCAVCGIQLKQNTYHRHHGKLYCKKHLPKLRPAKAGETTLSSKAKTPVKVSEGQGTANQEGQASEQTEDQPQEQENPEQPQEQA